MISKVYINSSVIGGVFDPEFSTESKKLFQEFVKGLFAPVLSTITEKEIRGAPSDVLRFFKSVKRQSEIIEPTEEATELAGEYLREGKFSKKLLVDALKYQLVTVKNRD